MGVKSELDELAPGLGDRGERIPAVPGQLGREALVQVAREGAVHEQRPVRVAVRIDEPRSDHAARCVDHPGDAGRVDVAQVAEGRDPIAEHADVGRSTG